MATQMKALICLSCLTAWASASAVCRNEEVADLDNVVVPQVFQVDSSLLPGNTLVYSKPFATTPEGDWVFYSEVYKWLYNQGSVLLASNTAFDRVASVVASLGQEGREVSPGAKEHPVSGRYMIIDFTPDLNLRERLRFFEELAEDPDVLTAEFTGFEDLLSEFPSEVENFCFSPFIRSDLLAENFARRTFFGWISEKFYPWIWDYTNRTWFYIYDRPSWSRNEDGRRVLHRNLELFVWNAAEGKWFYYNAALYPSVYDVREDSWSEASR